jgi:nitrate/nitrite transport system substrate-binding protein
MNGSLDAAHVLYGLIYGVQLGIGGPKRNMNVLMTLNNNGQALTLASRLAASGVTDGASLAALMCREPREYVFAQTFPTGTHAMWLYYWLAAHGINPMSDTRVVTVPPPQMLANMRAGDMDGFCAGKPWNAGAIADGIGFTAATTQDIWRDHPEKVLGTTAAFTEKYPNTARALTAAVLEASRFIDASADNRRHTAAAIAAYVNAAPDIIVDRMQGQYVNGLGSHWTPPDPLRFFNDGAVNYPYLSDGMWFMTQHKRWGLLKSHPDYLTVARGINRADIYREAATAAGVGIPASEMRTATLMDGAVWDGTSPQAYADSFTIHG